MESPRVLYVCDLVYYMYATREGFANVCNDLGISKPPLIFLLCTAAMEYFARIC